MRLSRVSSLAALFLLAAPLVHASVAVYQYTGNPFTNLNVAGGGGDTLSNFISVSVTLSSPLANNAIFVTPTPLDWSITDGVHKMSATDGVSTLDDLEFSTDGSGAITAWYVQANIGPALLQTIDLSGLLQDKYIDFGSSMGAYNSNLSGVWVGPLTATPEPSAALLSIGGIGLLALVRRKRRVCR